MTYYVWYYLPSNKLRLIWAKGLSLEDAQAAVRVCKEEFGYQAGYEAE
jgi:hypothetical protein